MARYTTGNLIFALKNPSVFAGELERLLISLSGLLNRALYDNDGIYVTDQDWDTLVLLDGCRYDAFEEVCTLDGALDPVRSRGSESYAFIEENFVGRELHDTVYVTANPYTPMFSDGTFHAVIDLLQDEWDPNLGTVPPTVTRDAAVNVHRTYPDKRIIVHFMQPHYPFLGDTGRTLVHSGINEDELNIEGVGEIWKRLQYRLEDPDTVERAYYENLQIVLAEVKRLLDEISGRIVVSADHGNLLGERLRPIPVRGYGHPRNIYVPALVEVPWFVVSKGERRETTADPPKSYSAPSDDVVQDRLTALGYA